MKIRGTKPEIDFITQIIEENEVECDNCPYRCSDCSTLRCSEVILRNTQMTHNAEQSKVLMTFWDKALGHDNFKWFNSIDELMEFVKHHNIMKSDIKDVIPVLEGADLRDKL